jgi:hypothetical protein
MTARFEEEIGLIKKVVVDFGEGHRSNLAIISDPFYGESVLMDRVEGMTGEDGIRIAASSLIRNFEALEDASGRIVIIEEAHRLYSRKIGGFETMNRFLKMLASSDRLFITTWNSYSWKYLDEVLGLGGHFPKKIRLSKMGAGQIREMLLSGYEEGELTFVEEVAAKAEELSILKRASYKKTLMGHSLEIPYPVIEMRSIRSRLTRSEKKSPEEIFFDKLARISDGNPSVAEHLWKNALDYPKIMDTLKDPPSIDLDYDESFALGIVLSMGSIEAEDLSEILAPLDLSAERIATLLEERGLVSIDGKVVSIRAEALKSVVEHLRRLRLVW